MIEIRGSLLTRTTLVFAVAAITIVVLMLLAINALVVTPLLKQAGAARAASIELAANTYFELPEDRRADFELKLLINQGLLVSPIQQELPQVEIEARYFRLLKEELENQVGQALVFFESEDHFWVNLPSPADANLTLQIGFSSDLPYITQQIVGLVAALLAVIVVVIASYFLVRRIAYPIQQAVSATESFRGTQPFEPLRVEGPQELRSLATALNKMAHNVVELIENRTALLAGISHDLRTPMTRLRLAVELNKERLAEDVVERFNRDLEQLEQLLSNALEYASGTQESVELVPFHSFITSFVDGLDHKIEIAWEGSEQLELEIAPGAFSRVLANLVDNATAYGNTVQIAIENLSDQVSVHVLDDGPGIPEAEREKVFQPFYRLDSARGGTKLHSGLGLAIAKQLCDTYGWQLSIHGRSGRGTDVGIVLK